MSERNETESLNFLWLSWRPGDREEPVLDGAPTGLLPGLHTACPGAAVPRVVALPTTAPGRSLWYNIKRPRYSLSRAACPSGADSGPWEG